MDIEAAIATLDTLIAMADDEELETAIGQRVYVMGVRHGLKVAAGQESLVV